MAGRRRGRYCCRTGRSAGFKVNNADAGEWLVCRAAALQHDGFEPKPGGTRCLLKRPRVAVERDGRYRDYALQPRTSTASAL